MSSRITCDIPLNRVEGDLEIRVETEGGRVVDAWSSGTMFRGFENLLVGRGALDGLVITPRICGICSTTHLAAAAKALDKIAGVTVPDNAVRLRNLALMVEHCQSDMRQSVLMFLPDFTSPRYADHPLHGEAQRRYEPLAGERCIEVVRETKRLLEVIAILGGQWPHSSFMVPGGVTYVPTRAELDLCRRIIAGFRAWYERRVLGCPVEQWRQLRNAADLDSWILSNPAHRDGEVGFLLRFAREAGLHGLGCAHGRFISYGSLELPGETAVTGEAPGLLVAPGVIEPGSMREPFDPASVTEDVAASWAADYAGGRHPDIGETVPDPDSGSGDKYSWSKAPRYAGKPAETGPLAERLIAGDPLFGDLVARHGSDLVCRQLARMTRPAMLLEAMDTWLDEMACWHQRPWYEPVPPLREGRGAGLIEATRGALGHWVELHEGRIARYQIITPTAWNGSPRDGAGSRGSWEEALIGTPLDDPGDPLEAGHVVRSFDPCLVCTVHVVDDERLPLQC